MSLFDVGNNVGKVSLNRDRNKPMSSNTNLDKFISLNVLAKIKNSSYVISSLFDVPAVLNTDRMFLKPKS